MAFRFCGLLGKYEGVYTVLAFFWLALRPYFLGFYMKHSKEAKSLTFRRGSEVSQALLYQGFVRAVVGLYKATGS